MVRPACPISALVKLSVKDGDVTGRADLETAAWRRAGARRAHGGGPIARDSLVRLQRLRCCRSGLGLGFPSHPGPGVVAR
ncbi:hypothetical protein GCM10010276_52300 [Streptomyces longisporus]|uniref:Uncharacterized protein n=1 Tax=Streptomyces longisporus TaxID=1948 RepID=A0ABP5ZST0_STRLO